MKTSMLLDHEPAPAGVSPPRRSVPEAAADPLAEEAPAGDGEAVEEPEEPEEPEERREG